MASWNRITNSILNVCRRPLIAIALMLTMGAMGIDPQIYIVANMTIQKSLTSAEELGALVSWAAYNVEKYPYAKVISEKGATLLAWYFTGTVLTRTPTSDGFSLLMQMSATKRSLMYVNYIGRKPPPAIGASVDVLGLFVGYYLGEDKIATPIMMSGVCFPPGFLTDMNKPHKADVRTKAGPKSSGRRLGAEEAATERQHSGIVGTSDGHMECTPRRYGGGEECHFVPAKVELPKLAPKKVDTPKQKDDIEIP